MKKYIKEYISEIDKKELIDFTYEVFTGFNIKEINEVEISKNRKKAVVLFDRNTIVLIASLFICTIIQITSEEDANLNENMTFSLSYIVAFFSLIISLLSYFNISFKSRVSSDLNFKEKLFNLFFEEVEIKEKSKNNKKKQS